MRKSFIFGWKFSSNTFDDTELRLTYLKSTFRKIDNCKINEMPDNHPATSYNRGLYTINPLKVIYLMLLFR